MFSALCGYSDSTRVFDAPYLFYELDNNGTPASFSRSDSVVGVPANGMTIIRGDYFLSTAPDTVARTDTWFVAIGHAEGRIACLANLIEIASVVSERQDDGIVRIDLSGFLTELGVCDRTIADVVFRSEPDEADIVLSVLYTDSLEYRRINVATARYRWGLEAKRSISAGEVLSSEFVERVAVSGRDAFFSVHLDRFATRTDVSTGAIIDRKSTVLVRLVERFRRVDVYVRMNSAVVEVEGIALGNGAYGDDVRVRTDLSEKILNGVVTGLGMVYVDIS